MRLPALLVAAAIALQPTLSHAAETTCLTEKQAALLAGYALPSVITGATKRCSASLNGQSFLKANGPELAKRYSARKDETWPAAKSAFLTISKGKDDASKVFGQLSDSSLREMLDVVLEGMVAQEIPVTDCGKVDNFVRLLAPLPAENTAELVVMMVGLATEDKPAKPGKLALCKG